MNERMFNEINNILKYAEGDVIDFRVYKGTTFSFLVQLAKEHGRHAVGLDTFYGLEPPIPCDKNKDNYYPYPKGYAKSMPELVHQSVKRLCGDGAPYELYGGKLSDTLNKLPERKYALALFDLYHYTPTKLALEYVYDKMTPGGVIYILNYHRNSGCLASKAVDEFILEKENDVFTFPDMVYNDHIANICRLSCKQESEESNTKVSPFSPVITALPKYNKEKLNIALVLRTGGDTYNYKYVNALAKNIRNNTTIDLTISVLTDDDTGIDSNLVDESIKLKHAYPGWWSKIELFRPDIFDGQVFYLDLDTVIVRNIDHILSFRPYFAGIRDLYHRTFLQTGVMTWHSQYNTHLYENFVPRSHRVMSNYTEGDAKWIRENVYNYKYISDQFPKEIVSYKANCLQKDEKRVIVPNDASIICFHGRPRPHTITHPEITKHWQY